MEAIVRLISISSPEQRHYASSITVNTQEFGEIEILPKYMNSIYSLTPNSTITIKTTKEKNLITYTISNTGIIKNEKDQILILSDHINMA